MTCGTPLRASPFSDMTKTVRWVIRAASAAGLTPTTWKVSLPPKYGIMMLSPFVTGTLSSASARYRSSMGGTASSGATTTFSAGGALTFFTVTTSPMATPALFLMSPSILTMPLPSSEG